MNKLLPILLFVFISVDGFSDWPPKDKKMFYSVCVENEIQRSSYKFTENYCKCFADKLTFSTDLDYFNDNIKTERMKTLMKKIRVYCLAENTNE